MRVTANGDATYTMHDVKLVRPGFRPKPAIKKAYVASMGVVHQGTTVFKPIKEE